MNTKREREREKGKLDSFLESLMIPFLRFNHANVHVSTIFGVRVMKRITQFVVRKSFGKQGLNQCHQSLLFDAFENRKERKRKIEDRDEEKKKRLRREKREEK